MTFRQLDHKQTVEPSVDMVVNDFCSRLCIILFIERDKLHRKAIYIWIYIEPYAFTEVAFVNVH